NALARSSRCGLMSSAITLAPIALAYCVAASPTGPWPKIAMMSLPERFIRQRDQRIGGDLEILRVAAMGIVAIDLDRHLLAELLPAGAAMVALGAALIMMHHHALADARFRGPDRGADRDHDAARFVPGDDGAFGHRDAGRARLAFWAA